MAPTRTVERQRINKAKFWFYPKSELFPFGGISIALLEMEGVNIQEAGGARYYRNPDGTVTMEMVKIKDEADKTKPLSHTFSKEEWRPIRKKKKKVR